MQFTLNRRSTVPMYRQLAAELREQIVSGAMAEGYRLPPERELASRLEVNRTTVLQAYQQLKDEGLIASKVGKGTFVLPLQHIETARIPVVRHEPIDEEPKPSVVRPPWSVLFSDYSNRFTYHDIASAERAQRGDTIIDFATRRISRTICCARSASKHSNRGNSTANRNHLSRDSKSCVRCLPNICAHEAYNAASAT